MSVQKKYNFILILIMIFSTVLSGCQRQHSASDTQLVLGTVVNITVYGNTSESKLSEAVACAMDRAKELEDIFSANAETSELSYVNQNAARNPVKISDEMFTVLERSIYFARLSDGAFDPTLGRLIKLWGIGTENARVPSAEEIQQVLCEKNYEKIILDQNAQTVFFSDDSFLLDLGAIAKGYAADELKRLLTEGFGITCGLLNLGGNVITIGSRYDGKPWTLGIADPLSPQDSSNPALLVKLSDKTFVTSGDYQRYFEDEDGTRYHHILDGSTGYPANTGLASVTIITDCSMDADALSTAAFVSGREKAMSLIETLDGVEAVFITNDRQVYATSGLEGQLHSGSLEAK